MTTITIAAKTTQVIETPADILNIFSANGPFSISVRDAVITGFAATAYELNDINSVVFANESDNDVTIIYENAPIRITQSGGGNVNVDNKITVAEIERFPELPLNATVESVGLTRANRFEHSNITIAAHSLKQLAVENQAVNRKVTIQVQSENETTIKVGATATQAQESGLILRGSDTNPALAVFENESAIIAYNDSNTDAKIIVIDEYRV